MAANTHKCAVSDCATQCGRTELMCRTHWFKVPKLLRDRIWDTYRTSGVLSDEYWEAREAAIHAVEIQ